ncbi:exosortase system-associated protein, TIGR04073 family [Candidatus Auribacterota bacterium]
MKIKKILIFLFFITFLVSTPLYAGVEGRHQVTESSEKILRGCKNTLFCFLEIPYQIYKTGKEDGGGAAATAGLCKGLLMTPVRFASGILDIFTCFNHTDWEDEMSFD